MCRDGNTWPSSWPLPMVSTALAGLGFDLSQPGRAPTDDAVRSASFTVQCRRGAMPASSFHLGQAMPVILIQKPSRCYLQQEYVAELQTDAQNDANVRDHRRHPSQGHAHVTPSDCTRSRPIKWSTGPIRPRSQTLG